MTRRVTSLSALVLLVVACASARDTKSNVSDALLSLARDAQATSAQWHAAAAANQVTKAEIDGWNTFLTTFKARYQRLEDRLQLATTDKLLGIQADTESLRTDLARWRR